MPTINGRVKHQTFKLISDRVDRRLVGWRAKLSSPIGSLLNAVYSLEDSVLLNAVDEITLLHLWRGGSQIQVLRWGGGEVLM